MKKKIALLLVLAISLVVQAHEFWAQPTKFIFNPGENLLVNFKVGVNFIGEPWNLKKERLERIELHQQKNVKDLKDVVVEGPKDHLQIPLTTEGTHLIVMQSNNAFIELEAEKFNAYLKEDGLDEVYAEREKANALNKQGKESYARYTKLLVQVGKKTDDTFKKSAGLPVEIIPQQNPYALKVGDPVRFLILYEGKPLFGARVKVMNRYNNRTTVQNIYSQQDGMIETHVSNPGAWMVSFVKMVPSKDPKSDWQSYWGSLVFGIN